MSTQHGKLFIVSGPSGVGKTTLVNQFLQQYSHLYKINRVVTYTTKQPRSTEQHGVDYHFITQEQFYDKHAQGFFLESSDVYGALYGTPVDILDGIKQGNSYILVIDRVGAAQIIAKYPDAVLIWVQVSSISILSDRLLARKTDSLQTIQRRLFLAKQEIEQESTTPMYHYYIDNDDLKSALNRLFDIIIARCLQIEKELK